MNDPSSSLPPSPPNAPTQPSQQPYVPPPLPSPYDNTRPSNSDYVPLQGSAQAAQILLVIGIVVDVLAGFSTLLQINLLSGSPGGVPAQAAAEANDLRQGIVTIVQFGVFVVTGILFLMWMYRAHRNLKPLGVQNLEFTSGWAVGYFFVPFVNLIKPYQAMIEIWKASSPDLTPGDGVSWKNLSVPALLGWWWTAYIASNIVSQGVTRASLEAETTDALLLSSRLELIAMPFSIVSALLAIAVINSVTDRQTAKAARLKAANIPPNPTPFVY